MRSAKLDRYKYSFLHRKGRIESIFIDVDSSNDVTIADISSEINANDGRIYVEGLYFTMTGMRVRTESHFHRDVNTLIIDVVERKKGDRYVG